MVGCICFSKLPKNKTKQALSSGHGHRAQRVKLLSAFNAFLGFNFYASVLCCVTYLQWPVDASGNVGLQVATSRRTVAGGLIVMWLARTSTSVVY